MLPVLRQAAVLLALALPPALLTGLLHPARPDWHALATRPPMLSVATALSLQGREQVLWIDARGADAYARAHIPGALHLSEEDWDQGLAGLIPRWTPEHTLVVYCDNKDCHSSERVARRLGADLETTRVHVLEGGWQAWNREAAR